MAINEKLDMLTELEKPQEEKREYNMIRCGIHGLIIDRCERDIDCPYYLSCPWTSHPTK
jgi:hypothetical protein